VEQEIQLASVYSTATETPEIGKGERK